MPDVGDTELGEVLVQQRVITRAQREEAEANQQTEGGSLEEALLRMGLVTQPDVTRAWAAHLGREMVDLSTVQVSPALLELIPQAIAKRQNIVPINRLNGRIIVASAEPLDFNTLDNLRFLLGSDIDYVLATRDALQEMLNRCYGSVEESVDTLLSEFTDSEIRENVEFIKRRIKQEVFTSSFGLQEGAKIRIQGDNQVSKALELLPEAKALMTTGHMSSAEQTPAVN